MGILTLLILRFWQKPLESFFFLIYWSLHRRRNGSLDCLIECLSGDTTHPRQKTEFETKTNYSMWWIVTSILFWLQWSPMSSFRTDFCECVRRGEIVPMALTQVRSSVWIIHFWYSFEVVQIWANNLFLWCFRARDSMMAKQHAKSGDSTTSSLYRSSNWSNSINILSRRRLCQVNVSPCLLLYRERAPARSDYTHLYWCISWICIFVLAGKWEANHRAKCRCESGSYRLVIITFT